MRISFLIVLLCIAVFDSEIIAQSKSALTVKKKTKEFIARPVYMDEISNSLVVKNEEGREMEFFIDKRALIVKGGQEVNLNGLDSNSDLIVVYRKKRTRFYAIRIEQ